EEIGAGPLRRREREIGADHVERAVREVDEVHDAEHERQPRRHQKQRHAELQAVQELLEDEGEVHATKKGSEQFSRNSCNRKIALTPFSMVTQKRALARPFSSSARPSLHLAIL